MITRKDNSLSEYILSDEEKENIKKQWQQAREELLEDARAKEREVYKKRLNKEGNG